MKQNQYFITNDEAFNDIGFDFIIYYFGKFKVFTHKNLNVSIAENSEKKIIILGFIINPFYPEKSNQDIANDLINSDTKIALFKKAEKLSGRYIILYKSKSESLILQDCFSFRQLYYYSFNERLYLSSSEKLLLDILKLKPQISSIKKELIENEIFLKIHEQWILGKKDWDERFIKLLPNHYLNLLNNQTQRIPLYISNSLTEEDVKKETILILQNSIEAILKRNPILMPLTAGYDSRLLMAASIEHKNKIDYFIFNRKDNYIKRDTKIAKKIAKRYQLNFKAIIPDPLSSNFINTFKANFIVTRILQKTQNLQWFKTKSNNLVNVSGVGGELIRSFYYKNSFTTNTSILKTTGFDKLDIFEKEIIKWSDDVDEFSKQYNLDKNDLFYHEMRLGKWASKSQLEMDFTGIEEFSLFNNKHLMYSILLNIPASKRKNTSNLFVKKIMEEMLEGVTKIPFNPKTLRDYIKSIIFYKHYKNIYHKIKYRNK